MSNRFREAVDSISTYKHFWMCWHAVGIDTSYNKYLIAIYDLSINIFITIFYPIHLMIGLFTVPTQAEIFRNLAINITCIVCSVKHYILRYKLQDIRNIERILKELDARAVAMDEREYFNRSIKVGAQRVINLFFGAYTCSNLLAISSVLLSTERRLLYPAWFPFNWNASTWIYWLVLTYQIVGISMLIIMNLANDIYPPMSLCILGGHVRLLRMRISKIGQSRDLSQTDNERSLISCIEDHKKLIHIFQLLLNTISIAQLTQFIASGLIICSTLVYLLFFANTIAITAYFFMYLIAMLIELFPCCYYGSMLQQRFEELPYALFTSNWQEQSRKYQRNLRIFTELALKQITPMAGGIIGIHLNAFYGICKMSYSLYAVVMRVK